MKCNLLTLGILFLLTFQLQSQSLEGAWEWEEIIDGQKAKGVVIFTDKFQVATWSNAETGAFIMCNGGLYSTNGNMVTETVEFETRKPQDRVGKSITFEIEWDGEDKLRIKGEETWMTRIDAGEPGNLAGAWLISGRMREGQLQSIDTNRPRKTMKILSGTRFQWIAYNTETKEFFGTGGGTYTTENGKYTENIKFFSRDDSRVGASLEFSFELKDGDWHHSGKSSKGNPIYEVWSPRKS